MNSYGHLLEHLESYSTKMIMTGPIVHTLLCEPSYLEIRQISWVFLTINGGGGGGGRGCSDTSLLPYRII